MTDAFSPQPGDVNFHDTDLIPIDASAPERDRIVRDFKVALEEKGLIVSMVGVS